MFISTNFLAVAIGGVLGCWLRWVLGVFFNAGTWPWGTLTANLVGGYLIGVMIALVAAHPDWPAWIRLASITGFLGGLTTFSTFSAETVAYVEKGAVGVALLYAGASLAGSLLLTAAGLYTVRSLVH